MFLSSGTGGLSKPITSALSEIVRLIMAQDGQGLKARLFTLSSLTRADFVSIKEELIAKKLPMGFEFVSEFFVYIQTRSLATSAEGNANSLETLSTGCLRKLVAAYIEHDWLLPVLMSMMTLVRKRACEMDSSSDKWKKKIVEIFRELFPILHKERERLPGTCWLICQLLNLYMELDQVKLCSHILAALTQSLSKEGGFDPSSVPKSVAVTLFYYWGKFHVMESKYQDAHAKLVWAFAQCVHAGNRKRIAEYLIPSMIVIGVFPKHELIATSGLEHFDGLVKAIRIGDVESYNLLLESHSHILARSGTLVLMEKCKLICYRNLAKRTFIILKELTGETAKFDLSAYEAAWKFAEHATKNEAICALADLIYAGAMKGYMALEHDKLVLSKVNPFPSIDSIL
jgi:hypothetical protein